MDSIPPRSVEELGLDDSDELAIYLELIRIIEKDIDEERAGDARNGWTTWAIIGGLAGALLLFFGETRKLSTFPTEQVETISLAGALLYTIAIASVRLFSLENLSIRPGRIRWSNEAYFSFVPSAIYTLLTLFTSIAIAGFLPLTFVTKLTTISAFALWTLLTILMLVLSKIPFPFGNNRLSRKSASGISLLTLLLSVVAVLLLGVRIQFPVGEIATVPFILSGLILTVVLLVGHLIHKVVPSRLLSNLQDLRNDIVFLRVNIDEALRRYEILSEGETLPDALKKELGEIVNDLNVIEYTHANMSALNDKMARELPFKEDTPETKKEKASQFVLDRDSYALHDSKCSEILNSLQTKLNALTKKLGRLSAITEDRANENTIRTLLTLRLQRLQTVELQLKERSQQIIYYANNPDKIPDELRTPAKVAGDQKESGDSQQSELIKTSQLDLKNP